MTDRAGVRGGAVDPRAVPLSRWDGVPVAELATRWGVPSVEAFESIGSTNDRAAALASAGAPPYTVVVADAQTEGRGRRGARWWSPPGAGLLLSVVVPPASLAAGGGCLPLVVGLATAEGIERVAHGLDVEVKWPNDLFVRGRKLGGILCEASGGTVVVGVGVNVLRPAEDPPSPLAGLATSLEAEAAPAPTRADLAGAVVERLRVRLGEGGGALTEEAHEALRRRDALLGHPVHAHEHGEGIARGIERDGALLLERPGGVRIRVVAGGVTAV